MYLSNEIIDKLPIGTNADIPKEINRLINKHQDLIEKQDSQPYFYFEYIPSRMNFFQPFTDDSLK